MKSEHNSYTNNYVRVPIQATEVVMHFTVLLCYTKLCITRYITSQLKSSF